MDELTIEQDDWLIPIALAIDAERDYRAEKQRRADERKSKAKQNRG